MAQQASSVLRRRFRSRAEEHEAIDDLIYEPGRSHIVKEGNEEPKRVPVPLSPKRRKDLHTAADDRWDALKKAGQDRIRATNESLADAEDRVITSYQWATKQLESAIEELKDGDLSIETGDELLENCGRLTPSMRKMERGFENLREDAGRFDTSDPEALEFERVSEEFDRYPELKTRPHPTEVEW